MDTPIEDIIEMLRPIASHLWSLRWEADILPIDTPETHADWPNNWTLGKSYAVAIENGNETSDEDIYIVFQRVLHGGEPYVLIQGWSKDTNLRSFLAKPL